MSFTLKTTDEIVADIIINIVGNVPDVNDVNVGSVLRNLTEAVGLEINSLYTELDNIFKGTRILTATDTDLENLGDIVGITRKQGTKTSGFVTFSRLQPATSDFVIPQSQVISTQPNTGEEQLRFLVKADTTFKSSITSESHKFINGIYDYNLDERFINSISQVTGTVSSASHTFTATTDYVINKNVSKLIIDTSTLSTLDDCNTADFTESVDASAEVLDTLDKKQGTGSLKLGKTGTSSNIASYSKVLSPVIDGGNNKIYLWLYFLDQTTIDKLNELNIIVGSGGSSANSKKLNIVKDLQVGWKLYEIDYSNVNTIQTGIPNFSASNYIEIEIKTNNATDTLSSGDIKMDFWFFAIGKNYEGDVITWNETGTLPDDTTNFLTDYVPLSKEVEVEAEDVGIKYNVGKHKIIFKVSTIANIDNVENYDSFSGGTDKESDDDLRLRIQNAADVSGKATANAIKQAALGVEGITSASVDDTPTKTQTDEPIVFHNNIDDYKLDYEVANDNTNLKISNTIGGSSDYINGTDYILQDSTIIWQSGGSKPSDNAIFYVTYDYEWLGHADLFISGTTTPLPSSIINNVKQVIDDTKAAGVEVSVTEPTVININVDCKFSALTSEGYSFNGLKSTVEENLRNYINTLPVGKDVYVSELIKVIQETTGVENSSITTPASDIIISVKEISKACTITITQL